MITVSKAVETINGQTLFRAANYERSQVAHVVACDLMSDVLVVDVDNILLVTSLVSRQSLKTAHLVGASAICIVNEKAIPDDLLTLAQELDLTLIRTPLDKFACCVQLGKALEL